MSLDLMTSKWQELMDAAYDRWNARAGSTYKDMLDGSSEAERAAVLLGNLNKQVENGGLRQWVDNGYGLNINEVIELLDKIGQPNSLKVSELLKQLEPHINLKQPYQGFGGNYWVDEDEECRNCGGGGYEEVPCDMCGGTGSVEADVVELGYKDCQDCIGTGMVEHTCGYCNGQGTNQEPEGGYVADRLDEQYYEISEDFHEEVEAYLKEKTQPGS